MMWTQFWDMNSGGGRKEDFGMCYIEAPVDEARIIFYNRFGHNPDRVSCTCCGADYSIDESESLEQATGYDRGCDYDDTGYVEKHCGESYRPYVAMSDYIARPDIYVIPADKIAADERTGDVPQEGYVWHS